MKKAVADPGIGSGGLSVGIYYIGLPAVLIKAGDRFDLKYLYSVTQTLQERFELSRKL